MSKKVARKISSKHFGKTAAAAILLASLIFLSGCQGLSSGGSSPSSTQDQSSTLSLNTTTLDFGNVEAGDNASQTVTATNSGPASVTISGIALSTQYFSLSAPSLPVTLAAGQSTPISITFSPNATGAFSATATITSDASNVQTTLSLSGTGTVGATGQLTPSPSSLSFGSVTVGSTQPQTVTLTNTGGTSVNISQASIKGTGFQLSGITTPITLSPSQTTTFVVTFAPQSSGSASGTVTITSDGSNPSLTVALTGTGVAAGDLAANPTSLSFGSVTVGSNQSLSETVTNTGGESVTISAVATTGSAFSFSGITTPVTLTAGQSATFNVTFTPNSTGSASGTLTVTSDATNSPLTVGLSGTGVAAGTLAANPTSLSFGSVTVGGNQSLSETLTNTGGESITISKVAISGGGFSFNGISTPLNLASGQSATFSVTFAPNSTGSVSGNVTVTSTASDPTLTIPVSGDGTAATGQLSASPSTLGVGSVVVGTSGTATGTLTASGASVTVTAASTNNSVFTVSGLSLPVTIPNGQSVSYTVTFSPQSTGGASATLTFTSNAQPSTTTENLTGTGSPAPTHSANLSWIASTSQDISGYNIYRALYSSSSCGSFSKINAQLNTGTLYTDSSVVDGKSYCYATTAVNTSNEESSYSNIVSNIQIPAP